MPHLVRPQAVLQKEGKRWPARLEHTLRKQGHLSGGVVGRKDDGDAGERRGCEQTHPSAASALCPSSALPEAAPGGLADMALQKLLAGGQFGGCGSSCFCTVVEDGKARAQGPGEGDDRADLCGQQTILGRMRKSLLRIPLVLKLSTTCGQEDGHPEEGLESRTHKQLLKHKNGKTKALPK